MLFKYLVRYGIRVVVENCIWKLLICRNMLNVIKYCEVG